jgi:hypothetical protein
VREPGPNYSCKQYERPNQPWVCGLTDAGHACAMGPTSGGQCPALGECAPVRDGDRWRCNRSTLRGGECDEGPTPEGGCGRVLRCRPVRSLRAKRGRFVAACTILAGGVLTIMLSANWRDAVINPGPLSQSHAPLMARGRLAGGCAACHSAAERSIRGWAATAVGHGGGATQSELCMNCHNQTISQELALVAHNVPSAALGQVTSSHGGTPAGAEDIACATCHHEHRGSQFDVTAMTNAACQACHQHRYRSFAVDHPDFGAWPYKRRTSISFNHASHQTKHFAQRKQAFDCRQCHLEDASGRDELLASYETACAGCHDEKITTSLARGVPMLLVPTLDVDALKAAGHDIGSWPESATGDFDGRLPPAMKLLLAADPNAATALAALGPDFEFFDVDPDDEHQVAACAELATAIKSMFADVSQRGPAAVKERLSVALGREVSDAQLDALTAGLSEDTLHGAVAAWLPGVDAGDTQWSESSGLRAQSAQAGAVRTPPFALAGEWLRDEATLSIRYRPAAHADPVLASWLSLLVQTPDIESRPLAFAMFKELAKPTAPGLCASCHSVECGAGDALVVNWAADESSNQQRGAAASEDSHNRGFTKFSHGPHLLLPQLADCSQCHAIDPAAATATPNPGWNPAVFVSEFRPLSKQMCATCHTATAAGDACQSCHNYHVDAVETWRSDSDLSGVARHVGSRDNRQR